MFDYDIKEGGIYEISHLYARPNIGSLMKSFHRLRLEFDSNTKIRVCMPFSVAFNGNCCVTQPDFREAGDRFTYMNGGYIIYSL
jgi:hypothetical protein